MNLNELINAGGRIAIQCHNIPDADALASGYGLFRFFEAKAEGAEPPKFFYSGPPVTKPNLTKMIDEIGIPVEHAPDLTHWDGLLVTVDSQYGAGNITRVDAGRVAVVDHHIQEVLLPELCDLRPWLGSCSTLVWSLLRDAGFAIDVRLGTALHYGLFSDTNAFSEIRHPLDRDMWDTLTVDSRILRKLKRSNLALSDLAMAAAALNNLHFNDAGRFVLVATPPCDPNLLGFISDLAMQVDSVDSVIIYSEGGNGYKFSVRTSAREAKASELAAWLAGNIGSGGGHYEKAGGYISKQRYEQSFGGQPLRDYFTAGMKSYIEAFKVIDCNNPAAFSEEYTAMNAYRKLPVRLGFVPCGKLFDGPSNLRVRMLEGDLDISADEETVLMIGVKGEIYPMEMKKFTESYTVAEGGFSPEFSYSPTVMNKSTGINLPLLQFAQACVGVDDSVVRAMRLQNRVKVFTRWDDENYLRGDPGDWLVARSPNDLYVITEDVFEKLYIRDCSELDLSDDPGGKGAVQVVKKSSAFVVFASEPGVIGTREGQVSYEKGDALLTGVEGEPWPVTRERFLKTYVPASSDIEPAQDGEYRKNGLSAFAWALQMDEPFMVELPGHRGTLRGAAGDWLLWYAPDECGIIGKDVFSATYEPAQN